jgi:hypothetical protein
VPSPDRPDAGRRDAADLLDRFVDTFARAVAGEMEAMRQRMGPYEIPVDSGLRLDDSDDETHLYTFRLLQPNDKLVQGGECNLVTERGDDLVTVVSIDADVVTLALPRRIEVTGHAALVVYPWFLYERLQQALQALRDDPGFHTDTALALFGRAAAATRSVASAQETAAELNDSQQRAVDLCRRVSPAFVWGPPGTGKTTTLGHILLALLDGGQRILLTSTTNAAVDQALGKLADLPGGRQAIDNGLVVRLGQTAADTRGAGLRQVVDRRHADTTERLAALQRRRDHALAQVEAGRRLHADLAADTSAQQLGLFAATAAPAVDQTRWLEVFGRTLSARLAHAPQPEQLAALERRTGRLERVARLCAESRQQLREGLRGQEAVAVAEARLVLATMTNVYMSSLMEDQRFDTIVVEEAGMAILPTLFYCTSLGRAQAVMVGDPRQLPPIVQSSQPFVQRAMGRSIFEVTVPDPHDSDLVVMLDTQYRMHPRIGDLVGGLFYDGRLRHGDVETSTDAIAARAPAPGEALVLVDSGGRARCQTPAGSYSRFNTVHAEIAVDLARQASEDGGGSIAIITPYAEQARQINRLLGKAHLDGQVECRTVHRFQGGERDVVIFDTVDAEPMLPGRLLSDKAPGASAPNLINVSLSRARGKLLLLADAAYFQRHDPGGIVQLVLEQARRSGCVLQP